VNGGGEGPARPTLPAPHPALGLSLVLLLGLIWGSNWPAIRVAVQEIPPWSFRAICLAVGSAMLFAVSLSRGMSLRVPRREILPLIFVGLANVTGWHMLTAFGLTMTEASRGVLLAFTFPLWSLLFGALMLGERLTRGRVLALALGLGAILLLLGPEIAGVERSPLGGLLLVGSAISWALATIAFKMVKWTIGSGELAAWQLVIGGAPIIAVAVVIEPMPDFAALSVPALIGLVYASTIAVSFGQWIWFRVLQIMPAGVAAISSLAVPIVGVFSSALLIGETLGWRELAALALVCSALAIVLVGREGWSTLRRMLGRA
jgi:drug/metabolite transporter (DMT)-like permease